MKRIQTSIAFVVALAFVGIAPLKSVDNGQLEQKAIVRAVHGNVQAWLASGEQVKVKPNMEFDPGVKIQTGPDSSCDLSVNGVSSVVRVLPDTIMMVPTMTRTGSGYDADLDTQLNLQTGTLTGNVKKLSANSRYEITTPHGVAGIRGTDFRVEVTTLPNGEVEVTFYSLTGTVYCSALINNSMISHVLRSGEQWTVSDQNPAPTPQQLLARFLAEVPFLNVQNLLPQPPPIAHPFTGTTPEGGISAPSSPSGNP